MEETFDVYKATKAQEKYCNEKGYPHFAPHSGICFRCRKNIYMQYTHPGGCKTGISVEKAGSTLITGCPHCCWSYCD